MQDIEAELAAIRTLQETLQPLDADARTRVIGYAFGALGITTAQSPLHPVVPLTLTPAMAPPLGGLPVVGSTDILTLKEQKEPSSFTEMVAVMAYYLAQLAPEGERRDYITAEDVQKYFVQGQYPLPGSHSQAMVHAKNAGYLDSVEKGKYRLNSVGHNLVAHKMPKQGATARKSPSGGRRKPVKKTTKTTKKK